MKYALRFYKEGSSANIFDREYDEPVPQMGVGETFSVAEVDGRWRVESRSYIFDRDTCTIQYGCSPVELVTRPVRKAITGISQVRERGLVSTGRPKR